MSAVAAVPMKFAPLSLLLLGCFLLVVIVKPKVSRRRETFRTDKIRNWNGVGNLYGKLLDLKFVLHFYCT